MKTYQLPEAGRTAKGKAMVNLLQLSENVRVTTALPVRDFKEGYLVMFTKNGTGGFKKHSGIANHIFLNISPKRLKDLDPKNWYPDLGH